MKVKVLLTQSCPTLCDLMTCSMAHFLVHYQLLELAQTHVHLVVDDIQPSHSFIPFSSCLQSFPASGSFPRSQFTSGGQNIGVSASASILPMNIQDWFPLRWTGLISLQSKGLSRVFSSTTVQKHQFFAAQLSTVTLTRASFVSKVMSLALSSTLTSIHDYWKNHSFDYMDLCWQSNVCAF